MATLKQIDGFAVGNPQRYTDFKAARLQVAWGILAENPATPNHAARLAWAKKIFSGYETDSGKEYLWCLSHPNLAPGPVSDANMVAAVASFVDVWSA